jgi:hypothetical protein
MNESLPKVVWRLKKTLRSHGRRAITPPRRGKTRGHVDKRHGLVFLSKRADTYDSKERKTEDAEEFCGDSERERQENSDIGGGGETGTAQEQEIDKEGSGMYSEMSIHSRPLQGLSELPKDGQDSETQEINNSIPIHPFFSGFIKTKE